MGGKEGSRGYLYQAYAAVLEALTYDDWDKISIEYPTENDKVDIALEKGGKPIKCIQVKSTINTFSKIDLKSWLLDLSKDEKGCPEYELFLIGNCNKPAIDFKNAIDKYYSDKMDKTAESALKGFDRSLLKSSRIYIEIIPFSFKIFQRCIRDSLHEYLFHKGIDMTYDQLEAVENILANKQMNSSTDGKGTDRELFDKEMKNFILLMADKHTSKSAPISIISFSRGVIEPEDKNMRLSLLDMFDGRHLKENYDWNTDVYKKLDEFLTSRTEYQKAYQISLDTHASIAFATGHILDSKSGINIRPIQKTTTNGVELWEVKPSILKSYSDWKYAWETLNDNQFDCALIINANHKIHQEVMKYIKKENLPIGRIVNCTLNEAGKLSIEDGYHAATLAAKIDEILKGRSIEEQQAKLHIFSAAPNAFMFFLGQNSRGFGRCILYEYDFEKKRSCSYSPSISLLD